MKIIIGMLLYSFIGTILITLATDHVIIGQYLLYFYALIGFVIAGNELIKLEDKGEV